MGNTRGTNRFAAFQEGQRNRRIKLIETYLEKLAALRTQFSNVTQLAEAVAQYITEKETEAGIGVCSASTLLRNIHYKAPLVLHYESQASRQGAKSSKLVDRKGAAGIQQIQVQLRCINLANENARLKKYIAQIEDAISLRQGNLLPAEQLLRDHEIAIAALRADYAQTCKTLLLLLRRFEHYVEVDHASNSIVDSAIKRGADRIIAGPEQAGAFCRWLDSNPFPKVGIG